MKIYSLNKSKLAKKVINLFQDEEIDNQLIINKFSDGEFCPVFTKSVRQEDVYIMMDGHSSDDIMKLLLTIDAAKRSGCSSVSLIAPYLPYSRSDKNDHIRQSISAKLLADIITSAGVSNVITIDLHNNSIQGFYNVPVIHLLSNRIFIDYIRSLNLDDLCFVAPDHGATKRTLGLAKYFPDSTFAVIDKKRTKPNEVASMTLLNPVEGKNVIIIDDLGDTMGTICKASDLIMQSGAKSVRGILTHPVLSGSALENIRNSSLTELIVSDSIVSVYDKINKYNIDYPGLDKPRMSVITCADLLANSLNKIICKESINELNY